MYFSIFFLIIILNINIFSTTTTTTRQENENLAQKNQTTKLQSIFENLFKKYNLNNNKQNAEPCVKENVYIQDVLLSERDLIELFGVQRANELLYSKCKQYDDKYSSHRGRRIKKAATAIHEKLWPDGIIPYHIASIYKNDQVLTFIKAMRLWESQSCILFVEQNDLHTHWINILEEKCGCCSMVGRNTVKGGQNVSLGEMCDKVGIAAHEFGHVIGFWHEHTRPDRDKFIAVLNNNIKPGQEGNFLKKNSSEIDTLGEPYDFLSIMHYANNTFSRNELLPTLVVKDPLNSIHTDDIGQRNNLSKIDVIQTNKLYKCLSCMKTFYKYSDTIALSKANTNKMCVWRIKGVSGVRIKLKIDVFNIGPSNRTCKSNYISIYDGPTNKSVPLAMKACGASILNFEFTSTQQYLFIQYVSSTAFERRVHQFNASYTTICGGNMTGSFGSISSPNFPDAYPNNLTCEWLIKMPSKYTIEIQIVYLNIEQSTKCDYDYLKVFDGSNEKSTKNYTFCGQPQSISSIHSSSNEVFIRFNSDLSINSNGFMLNYKKKYDICKTDNHGCEHTCVPDLNSGYHCECDDDFILADDGKSCLIDYTSNWQLADEGDETCGGYIDATQLTSGLIRSPRDTKPPLSQQSNYGLNYPMGQSCKWIIKANRDFRIIVNVTHLDIEGDKDHCKYDFLRIYSLNEDDSVSTEHGTFCGSYFVKNLITSTTSKLAINFQSDSSVSKTGFSLLFVVDKDECLENNGGCSQICENQYATYECKCTSGFKLKENGLTCEEEKNCDYKLENTEGLISSPHFPKDYPDNRSCSWSITVKNGHRIQLVFKFFNIEESSSCIYDYLRVIDGDGGQENNETVNNVFCGSELPSTIISTTKTLSLFFISDTSGSRQGFQIQYSIVCGGDYKATKIDQFLYSNAKYGLMNYLPRQNCIWKIKADANQCVSLTFHEFEIESYAETSSINECQYDFVEINELSKNSTISKQLAILCGFRKPNQITSNTNEIEIKFQTDSDQEFKGFLLSYKSVKCNRLRHKP